MISINFEDISERLKSLYTPTDASGNVQVSNRKAEKADVSISKKKKSQPVLQTEVVDSFDFYSCYNRLFCPDSRQI